MILGFAGWFGHFGLVVHPMRMGAKRMLPSGEIQLIVNLHVDALRFADSVGQRFNVRSGTVIQGMQSRAVELDRGDQRHVMGVVFAPGAGRVLLGVPLDALSDTHVELNEVVRDVLPLREYLLQAAAPQERFDRLERWLWARIEGEVDPMIHIALWMMHRGEQSVATLASAIGTTKRTLRRRFRAEVGLPPKQMGRVLRFQRALQGLYGCDSLSEVASSSGYYDQAHLTHELRELAGISPSEYRRRRPLYRNHLV